MDPAPVARPAEAAPLDWQAALRALRARLPSGRGPGGVRGSLRWLEAAMRASGATPTSVRNIIYRDVGTPADRAALHAVLSELGREVGLPLPPLPPSLGSDLPLDLELLGRSKRRAFRQFLAPLRAGRPVRLVVAGPQGVGKTLLIEHLERAILALPGTPAVTRLLLGDLPLDDPGPGPLHAGLPYAVQAARQAEGARTYLTRLLTRAPAGVLLVRVERGATVGGLPPRSPGGEVQDPALWAAEHLYRRAPAALSVLLALADDPDGGLPAAPLADLGPDLPGELIRLTLPTPTEARRYLMSRLKVGPERADELLRQSGRHLDRLTLLAAAQGGEVGQDAALRMLADPPTRALVAALAVSLGDEQSVPRAVLERALGRPLGNLPAHVRGLLDEVAAQSPRPVSRALYLKARTALPAAELQAAARRLAAGPEPEAHPAHRLRALASLGDWAAVADWTQTHPADAALAAELWPQARRAAGGEVREALARQVVSYRAIQGGYTHPQARDALFTLLASARGGVRAWARVKLAESSVDAGNFGAAEAQLAHPELAQLELVVDGLLEGSELLPSGELPSKPVPPVPAGPLRPARPAVQDGDWWPAAHADALLVQAALARWRGDLESATRLAQDPRAQQGGSAARAALWRGLIAKDAGHWAEATRQLERVQTQAQGPALLSARARYQEGDLRLRLGQPQAALALLRAAATQLDAEGGSSEERARALARSATTLRRLGRPDEALAQIRQARALAAQEGDPVLRARLESEAIPVWLALGQPEAALRLAGGALSLLAQAGSRQAEATYRARRTHYRTALAYLTRGAGLPYLPPFSVPPTHSAHPDIAHARQLLDRLLERGALPQDREQVLKFDMYLSRALAEADPERAAGYAQRALAMTDHPYAEAQARAGLAEAALRQREPGTALHEVNRAHALLRRVALGPAGVGAAPAEPHQTDPGLRALLALLEARALWGLGEALPAVLLGVQQALEVADLRPFCPQVWRELGRAAETDPAAAGAVTEVFGPPVDGLRLSDALPLLATREAEPEWCTPGR